MRARSRFGAYTQKLLVTMEGGPRRKTGQSSPSTLFLESDFNFDGLGTQNPNELSDRLGFIAYQISTEPYSLQARRRLFPVGHWIGLRRM